MYNPDRHHRRSIRLKGYDYSRAGAYFVTICTHNRECLFGEIAPVGATGRSPQQSTDRSPQQSTDRSPRQTRPGANDIHPEMILNEYGAIVQNEWIKTAEIRDEIELDEFVVMPNHFHGIVLIIGRRGDRPVAPTINRPVDPTTTPGPQPKSIGSLIAGFKSAATKRVNEMRNTPGAKLWQRNYYEHIIRNENELHRIREYIRNNPMKWTVDRENPNVRLVRETPVAYGDEPWMI